MVLGLSLAFLLGGFAAYQTKKVINWHIPGSMLLRYLCHGKRYDLIVMAITMASAIFPRI